MRPRIDGSVAIFRFDPSTPEDDLSVFVRRFQFQPEIEGIDCAGGESVPHVPCTHDDIDPNLLATLNCGVGFVDGCDQLRYVRDCADSVSLTAALHHTKGAELRVGAGGADTSMGLGLNRCCGTDREDIDAHLIVLEEVDRRLELFVVFVHEGQCRIRCGKAVAMDLAVDIRRVF